MRGGAVKRGMRSTSDRWGRGMGVEVLCWGSQPDNASLWGGRKSRTTRARSRREGDIVVGGEPSRRDAVPHPRNRLKKKTGIIITIKRFDAAFGGEKERAK